MEFLSQKMSESFHACLFRVMTMEYRLFVSHDFNRWPPVILSEEKRNHERSYSWLSVQSWKGCTPLPSTSSWTASNHMAQQKGSWEMEFPCVSRKRKWDRWAISWPVPTTGTKLGPEILLFFVNLAAILTFLKLWREDNFAIFHWVLYNT